MIRTIIFILVFCCISKNSLAQDQWIPYNPNSQMINPYINQQVVTPISPIHIKPLVPVLYYELVPYYINREIISERYGLFCYRRTITYQPNVIWVYQPSYRLCSGAFQ
jgi:hypothetical protein